MTSNEDCCHLGGYDANEGDVLIHIHAFSNQLLSKSPHFISAKILILECKLYIIRLARVFIEL